MPLGIRKSSTHHGMQQSDVEVNHKADHSETAGKHGGQQDQKQPVERQISTKAAFENQMRQEK